MTASREMVLKQIDEVLASVPADFPKWQSVETIYEVLGTTAAAVENYSPLGSTYRAQLAKATSHGLPPVQALSVIGVLRALRADWAAGRMDSFPALVRADVFGDLLDQASYLFSEGWIVPAAVLVGAALEAHLRKLATKHGIDLTFTTSKGDVKPKMASGLNDDLHKANAYAADEHKQITAWIQIRNDAAHGKHDAVKADLVKAMVPGVGKFLTRNPA